MDRCEEADAGRYARVACPLGSHVVCYGSGVLFGADALASETVGIGLLQIGAEVGACSYALRQAVLISKSASTAT